MLSVYEQRKDQDGFLYIVYTEESTLGEGEEGSK
jgi:Autophagy protein Atg8 ubiquitin like